MSTQPTEHAVEQTVAGMDEAGWSNSPAVEGAPQDEYPEVAPPEDVKPGWSNRGGAKAVAAEQSESKVVQDSDAEDKSVAKKTTTKKTAAKKSSASKKG